MGNIDADQGNKVIGIVSGVLCFAIIGAIALNALAIASPVKPDETLILPYDCTMDILSITKSNNGDWIVAYTTKEGKIKAIQYGTGQTFSADFLLPDSEKKQ